MLNLIHKAIPGFIATVVGEAAYARSTDRDLYEPRDTVTSLSMGVINVIGERITKRMTHAINQWCYDRRVVDVPLKGAGRELALIVADDFAYYWFHRLSHEVRLFWSAHVNHHSSQRYNLSTALRQSWLTPLTKIPFYLPLAFVGFTPAEIERAHHVNLIYQYWVHTELIDRLGPLEAIFSTPSHHRVHHGSNLRYLDRNYGGILIVWDRMFGTFEPEDDAEPVEYGLIHDLESLDLWTVEMHEFVAMLRDLVDSGSLSEAFMTLFGPPGWSVDGSSQTVEQMRAAAVS